MPMFIRKEKHGKTCKISRYCANPNYPLVYNSTSRAFCGSVAPIWFLHRRYLRFDFKTISNSNYLLSVLAASALFMDNAKDILVGYGSTALWMIIAAFSLSVAFGKTGLGHRVAYHLIRAFRFHSIAFRLCNSAS